MVNGLMLGTLDIAAGTSIIIEKGFMWCGEQLRKQYRKAEEKYHKNWTNAIEGAQARSRAQRSAGPGHLTTQLGLLALEQAYRLPQANSVQSKQDDQKALLAAYARARQASEDARESMRASREASRKLLIAHLKAEIELVRNQLPPEIIASAEAAIDDTTENIRLALERLQQSWQRMTDSVALQEHQRRQAQHLITVVTNQLRLADTMQQDLPAAMSGAALHLHDSVAALIADAQSNVATAPDQALEHTLQAQKALQELSMLVSRQVLEAWERLQSEANILLGTLTALTRMLEEALACNLANFEQVGSLRKRIAHLQEEVQVHNAGGIVAERTRLRLLTTDVEALKQDVFTFIGQRQQRHIAQTIAATLTELGYTPAGSGQSMIQKNGDLIHVEATFARKTSELTRDDKIASFNITSNGDINYDFIGFIGDSCILEAKRVFNALKRKGLYILDSQGVQCLLDYPVKTISSDVLEQEQFQPHIEPNKLQATISARLYDVLATMGYKHIVQNTIGGCIELDAFEGSHGYRIVLDPTGDTQVFNAGIDVSGDDTDPIVAEIHVLDERHESDIQESPQRTTSTGYTPQNKPQRQENRGR
jgi:hypothetical protein